MIPDQAAVFVGSNTGGRDITVQFHTGEEHADVGAHAQVFAGGRLHSWKPGREPSPDLCVHVPEDGHDWLIVGAPIGDAVSAVQVHIPGEELGPFPHGDLQPAIGMSTIPGATLVVQHIERGTPFGTIAYRQHFEEGVPVRFEWSLDGGHVVVNARFGAILGYRIGNLTLLEAITVGRIDGDIAHVSLVTGIVERPEYRAYLATNAKVCDRVRRWSAHVVAARWQSLQTLERARREEVLLDA